MPLDEILRNLIPVDQRAELEILLTMVFLEVDGYDGVKTTVMFSYQSLSVELLVYRLAEESQKAILTTGQRITFPTRPWVNSQVD